VSAILFLARDDAGWITGAIIPVEEGCWLGEMLEADRMYWFDMCFRPHGKASGGIARPCTSRFGGVRSQFLPCPRWFLSGDPHKDFISHWGVSDAEVSLKDYSQCLGYRPDLLIPGKYALWRADAGQPVDPESGRQRGWGSSGGMGRAMWSGVAVLSSSDYLDGVPGKFSLLGPCASKSIRFRVLS
jgi:hypothetical protein